ncbi:MAG: glycosyltransferase family 4 protein [Chloroflexi bacterium]|nr:MAG: glycosyltransferase family 4 protein [Chloroflexota bacterium]
MGKIRKILMLIENCPARADNRVWAEAIALRDYGFQVSIIGPKGAKEYRESYTCIEDIHVYQYRLPTSANKYIAYIAEYSVALFMTFWLSFKVLFRHGFDAIHTANPPDIFFMIGLFYRLLGKKFVFDQHDPAPEMFQVIFHGRMKPLYRLLLFFERCSYKTADLVITSNTSQKEFAIKRGHCSANKVFVVRNGPDKEHMKLVMPEPELKGGRRYLLAYLGVMGIQDGIEYAIYALYDLIYKRGRQDISLVLMGDGDHLPVLLALVRELQLDEYVTFTGWVMSQDITRYLTAADIGLTPDPQNGLNEFCTIVKTMEYMAMEKPVVAFDLAETRLSAQGAALYAIPNLVEDFADRIETLLDDDELRLKMGAIGRQRVEEELSWDHTKKNLLLAYEKLFSSSFESSVPDAENVVDEKLEIYQ